MCRATEDRNNNGSDRLEDGDDEAGHWLLWLDESGTLALAHLPSPALLGRLGKLSALYTLDFLPGETISQVTF